MTDVVIRAAAFGSLAFKKSLGFTDACDFHAGLTARLAVQLDFFLAQFDNFFITESLGWIHHISL